MGKSGSDPIANGGSSPTLAASTRDQSSEGRSAAFSSADVSNISAPALGPSAGPQPRSETSVSHVDSQSPYTATRTYIHDLTLPTAPNLDIPDSPGGSPAPGIDEKIGSFLQLKKQGTHFNQKLANSTALRNPSLLAKLMTFAGVDSNAQYSCTLPQEVWDPVSFPSWAFKEGLAQSQQDFLKKREADLARSQRDHVEFIQASKPASVELSWTRRG